MTGAPTQAATVTVLVYSHDATVRDAVRTAVGRRPAGDLPRVEWLECATLAEVLAAVDAGGVDVAVLDGEAWPSGGLGIAKQLKDELQDAPHTVVLVARPDDAWLATWSQADAVLTLPLDAPALTAAVATLLRSRHDGLPVRRTAPLR